MTDREDELVAQLASTDDNELIERWRAGGYADWAVPFAAAELRRRGIDAGPHGGDIDAAMPAAGAEQDLRTVYRAQSATEAQALRAMLEGSGIPAHVADAHLGQVNTLYGIAIGWLRVQVPASFEQEAQDVIAQYRAGRLTVREDMVMGEADEPLDDAPPSGKPWVYSVLVTVSVVYGVAQLLSSVFFMVYPFGPVAQPGDAFNGLIGSLLYLYVVWALFKSKGRVGTILFVFLVINFGMAAQSTSLLANAAYPNALLITLLAGAVRKWGR